MKFIAVSGYHAYDDDGNLIATLHIDSVGNFIIDNGTEALTFASDLEEAEAVHTLLGKLISEQSNIGTNSNVLNIVTEEEV